MPMFEQAEKGAGDPARLPVMRAIPGVDLGTDISEPIVKDLQCGIS